MNFEMLHPADQIVMLMNRIYYHDMTTTSGGNLSIKDSEGTIWISPSGVDKGNLRREDIIQIRPDGTITGIHRPSVEYPFHLAIYKKRPDIKAILHAFPPALLAYGLFRKLPDTTIIPDATFLSGHMALAPYALPGSSTLGDNISKEFANGADTVILENRGVVIGGETLFKAFMSFEMLEYCARIQMNAKALGGDIRKLSADHMNMYKNKTTTEMREFTPSTHTSEELGVRRDMCDLIHRAYAKRLFTSDQGTFSCKLSDGSIVITPYMKDRAYLEPEDLVLIRNGKKEAGKIPSRSLKLHQSIYANDPGIRSVIVAHPPHIMAFAITDKEFNTWQLPETYISLRDVKKYPFGSSYMDTESLAKEINMKNPAAIIENDCVIAAGTSLIKAFDKLEMMEYSAKALVLAATYGEEIIGIDPIEFRELESAFKL